MLEGKHIVFSNFCCGRIVDRLVTPDQPECDNT